MAGKHAACSVLQHSFKPAGGGSRPGTAWVGRIRSTAEKSKGCDCGWSVHKCEGRVIVLILEE